MNENHTLPEQVTPIDKSAEGVVLPRFVRLSLRDCKSHEDVCSLPRDNYDLGDCWILADGHNVTITVQKNGEPPSASVTLPRAKFNQLIKNYQRPQRVKPNVQRLASADENLNHTEK